MNLMENNRWDFTEDLEDYENLINILYDSEGLSSTESFVIPNNVVDETSHHVVYVKKRKYEKRQEESDQFTHVLKRKRGSPSFYVYLPRILKNDIRRKYILMYENVMNSFNYDLIASFFQDFFLPNVSFEKTALSPSTCNQTIIGLQTILSVFLLALQLSPDRTTRVFDIQLKQSSENVGKSEVSCRFISRNTKMYDVSHTDFMSLKDEVRDILSSSSDLHLLSKKKIKAEKSLKLEEMHEHQQLFDPISGIFLKSKFSFSESPIQYQVEGYMSFIINEEKRIERIIGRSVEISNYFEVK